MSLEQILVWVFGLIAAYLGVQWQGQKDKIKKLNEQLNEKKIEIYGELIKIYFDLISNGGKKNNKIDIDKAVEKLRKLNQQMLLFASAKVYKIYGDMFCNFYKDDDVSKTIRLLGEIIKEMRRDLKIDSLFSDFQWFDAMRPTVNDIDQYIPQNYKGDRIKYSIQYQVGDFELSDAKDSFYKKNK